jgi:hypothetical protein
VVLGRVVENLKKGTGRGVDNIIDVSGNKQQDDQENSTGEGTNHDTEDHDLGAFDRSVGDFFEKSVG